MKLKIVIPGGSGFLGKSAAEYFFNLGYEVIILTRGKSQTINNIQYLNWDGKTFGEWTKHIDSAAAVINFTGKSVNCIYTPENKKEIIDSRIDSVKIIAEAILQAKNPPKILIQAASLAIYGDTKKICDENAPNGTGFSVEVCKQWEEEFFRTNLPNTRKVLLRIGFVLGKNGGALETLSKLTKRFLGGAIASGEQYLSWLHIDDLNRMFEFVLNNENAEGIYNATGTSPTKNKDFMKALRKALHKPWSPPVPVFAVKIGARLFMKTDSSLALTGRNCIPSKLISEGFKFNYNDLETALKNAI
ncbi:MAG: TIGR01777 family oxidoreductase [Bacteroidetes bacterium]|nr:TIGR01777 family oxidoreductase [Bacteroidota bacterium]